MGAYTKTVWTNDASSPDIDATNLNKMEAAIKIGHDFADGASVTPSAGKAMVWPDSSIKVWRSDNDGSGSGLDADTVDGIHARQIIQRNIMESGSANDCATYTWTICVPGVTDTPTSGGMYWNILTVGDAINTQQLALHYTDNGGMFTRRRISGTWGGWSRIWNSINDGSGSGLETDKIPFGTKTGTSTGVQGQASFDANYLYLCTATNVWKRVALSSF